MENNLITIANVRGYVDENGVAMLNAEDVARGWGFVDVKDGNEYVRWARVNSYLGEYGFSPLVAKDDFIPEGMVYRLGFKASNEKAQKFQAILADEVIPSIRKHGAYMTEQTIEKALASPDFLIQLATKLKEEQTKNKLLAEKNAMQEQLIGELKPKADYVDTILCNKGTEPITTIAKDYGYSAKEFNKILHNFGIQYKVGKQWVLYSEYQAQGYTHTKVYPDITDGLGNPIRGMEWTQKGRLFLYNFLKEKGIVPMIEQD